MSRVKAMPAKRRTATQRRQMAGLWFVLPAFVVYVLFFAYPFFFTIYLSFTEWNGVEQPVFLGLSNYQRLAGDGLVWRSLWHNVIWVVFGTIIPIAIGLVLSVILWSGVKGGIVYRTVYFIPMVLSPVVVGVIWGWIYNPLFGLLNKAMKNMGLSAYAIGWLGDPYWALPAVLLTAIWSYLGFCVVVIYSGLQKVDSDLVDAARVDGANTVQRFINVIVPQIRSVLTMVLVFTIIGGFNVFDVVWVMTRGGPGNASELIATYTYKASFVNGEPGYGAALSTVMTALALLAAWLTLKLREA